ncbi:hypothetical protein K440DRAFT_631945 [Wilcoxina mikolae CBS 423.85]|nr:hypothetical protein K440DRAFT_631945 [Wilcoxina mikolae CBS 423.85]
MTQPTPASNALLTEHFGWTPLTLIDDVINTVNEIAYATIESVEKLFFDTLSPEALGFQSKPGTIRDVGEDGRTLMTDEEREELMNGLHQLQTLMESTVDTNFDRFELFVLRNLLVVKEDLVGWVRLDHHKGLDFSSVAPKDDTMDLDMPAEPAAEDQMRLRQLRQKFFATYAFNIELQDEKAANERVLSQLRNLVASTSPSYDGQPTPFSLISSASDTKDAAAFASFQLGQIRDHLAELKPKYDALLAEKEKAASEEGEISGPDAERKQYIEKMTRRHLELTRKLRLNARGDVVGGDFDSGELKKGSEEVQKLEEIAGKLSKGQR